MGKNTIKYNSKSISKEVKFNLTDETRTNIAMYIARNLEYTKECKLVRETIKNLSIDFDSQLENQRKAVANGMSTDEAVKIYSLSPIQSKIDAHENYMNDLKKSLAKESENFYKSLFGELDLFQEYCKFANGEKNTLSSLIAKVLNNLGIQDKKPNGVITYAKNQVIPYIGLKDKVVISTQRLTTAKSSKAFNKSLTNVLIDFIISINEEYIIDATAQVAHEISNIKAENI